MADIKVRIGQHNAVKVVSSLAGAQGLSLSELSDVNASTLLNGMVLVYNSATQKWEPMLSFVVSIWLHIESSPAFTIPLFRPDGRTS